MYAGSNARDLMQVNAVAFAIEIKHCFQQKNDLYIILVRIVHSPGMIPEILGERFLMKGCDIRLCTSVYIRVHFSTTFYTEYGKVILCTFSNFSDSDFINFDRSFPTSRLFKLIHDLYLDRYVI